MQDFNRISETAIQLADLKAHLETFGIDVSSFEDLAKDAKREGE